MMRLILLSSLGVFCVSAPATSVFAQCNRRGGNARGMTAGMAMVMPATTSLPSTAAVSPMSASSAVTASQRMLMWEMRREYYQRRYEMQLAQAQERQQRRERRLTSVREQRARKLYRREQRKQERLAKKQEAAEPDVATLAQNE